MSPAGHTRRAAADDAGPGRAHLAGLAVATVLRDFIDDEVLPGTQVTTEDFWEGLASLVEGFAHENRRLLRRRAELQRAIDDRLRPRAHAPTDADELRFLSEIGYLVPEGPDFEIEVQDVDPEIGSVAGPQLVVPVTNERYAINAVNARWGSLYDALYGTDALGDPPPTGPYDERRGKRVISWARAFLDETFPLAAGSHRDATGYGVVDGTLHVDLVDHGPTTLADPAQLLGHVGQAARPTGILLTNHGLTVEIRCDADHPIGATDAAGIADVVLESAVTVIVDFEDAVATVDVDDKVHAYRNWLGLCRGDLETPVDKDGATFVRRLAADREFVRPHGGPTRLPGRSLMLVRNVGLHLDTDAVLGPDGTPVPEGLLDAMVTVACGLHGPAQVVGRGNTGSGSIYVVKPKLHGPEEVAFTDAVMSHVEQALHVAPNTVKIGVMDEERRTSANLKECIRACKHRLAFINTGFLDRTGDEIHTSRVAGPMVRKAEMKVQPWMRAYEERNVMIGLACGLRGRAQIGKGMWAAPDQMAAMLEQKVAHPMAGASCAWVPSPTAATLHAIHYHRVDVAEQQARLAGGAVRPLKELLTVPTTADTSWSDEERTSELENNAQGILGYVVRWVDQGVGSSKVPDVHGTALMEDRATCRISSQHLANWLLHGVASEAEVMDVLRRMAAVVDAQNADDVGYRPMAPDFDGPAFRAAVDLVFKGAEQPSGYTEPVLVARRLERKGGRKAT